MIIKYLVLIGIFELSFIQCVYHRVKTVKDDPSESLNLDEAYLIVQNTHSSDNVTLYGNKIICESCDLEQLIAVDSNQSGTVIIDTKYAYDLELWSWPSNISLICKVASYKFAEHGTYLLDTMQIIEDTNVCSIEQIGNPSYYLAPAIIGILFVVLYTVFVQLWPRLYRSGHLDFLRTRTSHQRLVEDTPDLTEVIQEQPTINASNEAVIHTTANTSELPPANSTRLPAKKTITTRALPKRLRALDTFRGFSLMVMIFVNYGGGGYWFFDHSIWNGLTLADLLFPWFTWMMGVSIVLSQRSLRSKNVPKLSILLKICRRSAILFVLGFTGQDNLTSFHDVRILGVLQRLAVCYFITAILVLVLDKKDEGRDVLKLPRGDDAEQTLRVELFKSVFQYWIQWLVVILITTIWILITFLLHVPNCPTGYIGPGGKHDHGKHQNCTGGAAGYIDQLILGYSHLYDQPTCQEIYDTKIPYDPEGIMGNLTGVLLCYLGVQAGHIFVHSTRVGRICTHWLVAGIICGTIGLILSHGGHSNSWIPINKNLWSLTFVLILSSLAYLILTILYIVVDVRKWFTGAPFLWLGMNSIVIYIGHDRFAYSFPVQVAVESTHAAQLTVHLFGAFFWSLVAGFMYYKKFFIAI